jgi:hypothetical protein
MRLLLLVWLLAAVTAVPSLLPGRRSALTRGDNAPHAPAATSLDTHARPTLAAAAQLRDGAWSNLRKGKTLDEMLREPRTVSSASPLRRVNQIA